MNAVRALIKNHSVAVFSKSYCPFCKLAKETLKAGGASKFEVVELDLHENGPVMQEALKEMTGVATVPHVFIKQKYIGGGTDTAKLMESGKLEKLLKDIDKN